MEIETLEAWNDLRHLLIDADYSVWQCQFTVDSPEGFRASFYAPDRPILSIITHCPAVHDAIIAFKG